MPFEETSMVSVPCSCSTAFCSFTLRTDSNQPGSIWGGGREGGGQGGYREGWEGGIGVFVSRLSILQLVVEEAKPLP